MAESLPDEIVLTLHLTPDEALSLVAGPIVEGRDVSYAESSAYGKVWDALGAGVGAPVLVLDDEARLELANRLDGAWPGIDVEQVADLVWTTLKAISGNDG